MLGCFSEPRSAGSITGVSLKEGLAHRSEQRGGHLTLSGRTAQPLASAAARIAREMIRTSPLRDGWTLLHASAVVRDDRARLAFGPKDAGKPLQPYCRPIAAPSSSLTTGCS